MCYVSLILYQYLLYTSYVRYTEACLIYADHLLRIAQCLQKDNAEQLQPSKRDEIFNMQSAIDDISP